LVQTGATHVLIGHQPAARVGDSVACAGPDTIAQGASNVLVGFAPAARLGDPTTAGGVLAAGCPTVLIGTTPQAVALRTTAPFCAECEAARAARMRAAGQGP